MNSNNETKIHYHLDKSRKRVKDENKKLNENKKNRKEWISRHETWTMTLQTPTKAHIFRDAIRVWFRFVFIKARTFKMRVIVVFHVFVCVLYANENWRYANGVSWMIEKEKLKEKWNAEHSDTIEMFIILRCNEFVWSVQTKNTSLQLDPNLSDLRRTKNNLLARLELRTI